MFNPFQCRPIGSGRFEEHLKDVQTSKYYETEIPKEKMETAWHSCENCHLPWHEDDGKEEPWANLYWAIVINAFIDYLDEYERKISCHAHDKDFWIHESRCIQMENDYFRTNDDLEWIFDQMLVRVCWRGQHEIDRCRKQLKMAIGWLKRPDMTQKSRKEMEEERQSRAEERFQKLWAVLESDIDFTPEEIAMYHENDYKTRRK